MSQFEYLMVLAGVVVAVAMTEIVGAWGRILRTDAKVTMEPLFVGWSIYVLLLSMFWWVYMWTYQHIELMYMGQVWLMVFPALCLVLVAFALTPNVPVSGELDLRRLYFSKHRLVFLALIAFVVMITVAGLLNTDAPWHQGLIVRSVWIGGYLALAITKKPAVHWTVLILFLAKMFMIGVAHMINEGV